MVNHMGTQKAHGKAGHPMSLQAIVSKKQCQNYTGIKASGGFPLGSIYISAFQDHSRLVLLLRRASIPGISPVTTFLKKLLVDIRSRINLQVDLSRISSLATALFNRIHAIRRHMIVLTM